MQASHLIAAWLSTRYAMCQSLPALARAREQQWRRLQPALRNTPALAPFAGRALADFPIADASTIRANYGIWNSIGCSHGQLHAAAQDAEDGGSGEVRPGIVAGYSSGTGGVRGIFVASARERADYIGQSIARLLPPRSLLRPVRLALHLRANSRLYGDVRSKRFGFLHLPLGRTQAETLAELNHFAPTVLIAPPHRLLDLAEWAICHGMALPKPAQLFYGSEPMSEAEAIWLTQAFGVRPAPIYQATEGFLAGACRHGRLHLNDHSLSIELEPVAGTQGFSPIITDLRRRSQPIVRVRTDDYLETDPQACSCGFAGRVIRPVMGRVTDIWRFGDRTITPGQVFDTVDAVLGAPANWQAHARPDRVELTVDPRHDAATVAEVLKQRLSIPVPIFLRREAPYTPSPKRQRVSWADAHG